MKEPLLEEQAGSEPANPDADLFGLHETRHTRRLVALASPGRWPVGQRTCPRDETWRFVPGLYTDFSRRGHASVAHISRTRLTFFSPGNIQNSRALRRSRPCCAGGLSLTREEYDREDIPLDFRCLDFLLRASRDPEVALGSFAGGVRVGPRTRLPTTVPFEEKVGWQIRKTQRTTEKRSSRGTRPGGRTAPRSQHFQTRSKTFWTTKAGEDKC